MWYTRVTKLNVDNDSNGIFHIIHIKPVTLIIMLFNGFGKINFILTKSNWHEINIT